MEVLEWEVVELLLLPSGVGAKEADPGPLHCQPTSELIIPAGSNGPLNQALLLPASARQILRGECNLSEPQLFHVKNGDIADPSLTWPKRVRRKNLEDCPAGRH